MKGSRNSFNSCEYILWSVVTFSYCFCQLQATIVYTLQRAQHSFKSLVQIHEKSGKLTFVITLFYLLIYGHFINTATLLIWPIFSGPLVAVLTGFHCILTRRQWLQLYLTLRDFLMQLINYFGVL